jgi:hypothetical protein
MKASGIFFHFKIGDIIVKLSTMEDSRGTPISRGYAGLSALFDISDEFSEC